MTRCPVCDSNVVEGRSTPQHRRIWKLMELMFDHWAEAPVEAPEGCFETFRGWLLCKAGWRTNTDVTEDLQGSGLTLPAINLVLGLSENFSQVTRHKDRAYLVKPKSMKFSKMSHAQANEIFDCIDKICVATFNMAGDEMLEKYGDNTIRPGKAQEPDAPAKSEIIR